MNSRTLSIIAILGAAVSANAGLVVNGSFESVPTPLGNGGTWSYYNDHIQGWYSDATFPGQAKADRAPIEIGLASTYGVTGQDGLNVLELDSTKNSKVSQWVHGLNSQGAYTITFSAAQRAGTSVETNDFSVLWDNHVVANVSPVGTQMQQYSFTVLAGGAAGKLSFEGTGTSDSYG
jgi:hypothetical protein